MPLNIDLVQILLHMLNFVILAGGLTIILFKPVNRFLNERKEYYDKLTSDVAKDQEEARLLKAEYEEKLKQADAEIIQKKRDSEKESAEIARKYLDDAREQADRIIKTAELDGENRKAHIMETAQHEIGELVLSSAEKLLNRTESPERDKELYDEFIKLTSESQTGSVSEQRINYDR